MIALRKLVLPLVFFMPLHLAGQEIIKLSLADARQHAIEYNATVKNAGLAIDEAQKKINETLFSGLPQVNATLDYSNFMGAEMQINFGGGAATTIPFNPTSNLNVTVGQLIFSGSYIVGLQSAKLYKKISETNYQKTEQDIKEQITKSYYLALIADRSLEIIDENLTNTREILDKTKAMVAVGMAEKLDLDQFEVQLNQIENAKKSAERQKEMAYNLLRFQLGASVDTPVELIDSLNGLIEQLNYGAVVATPFTMNNNLDYQLFLTQEKLSVKQIGLMYTNFLPTLTGYYQYTYKVLKPELDFSPKNVIGLNLSVPIFSSGMRTAQLSQARIQHETLLNNKDLLTEQLLLQEKQYRFNLNNAVEQFDNRKRNVDVARRLYDNYQMKYEHGIASSLDLTISNNNYLQAESDYYMAIINLFDAQLALQRLMNTL
jgi:outer membrane protein